MIERIEIEDTSDCKTCTNRDKDLSVLLREVKITTLGETACQECGRQFIVCVPQEQTDA